MSCFPDMKQGDELSRRRHPFGGLCRGGLILALVFLVACAPPPRVPAPLNDFEQQLEQHAKATTQPELPPEVAQALLPRSEAGSIAEMPVAREPRFDVEAQKIPAREFFMGLVSGTPYNMVVQPGVEGEVSLSLKNVTIPEVMEVLRDVYGYHFRQTSTGFQVLKGGLQTELFPVNYLNLVRRGMSQTRVSSGQVSEYESDDDSDSGSNNKERSVVSGSQVGTESVADFWQELAAALRAMVGHEEGRQVIVQPQASVVVVRALPAELRQVGDYLAAIQGNLQRQVSLEAKILEVELSDGFQTGINWSLLVGGDMVFSQTGGGTIFDDGVSEIAGNKGILNPLHPTVNVEGSNTSAFGGVFSAALTFDDFAAFIELLETQGDVQVLSSPRISTVNNQKAVIKVGSDEFFVTDISSDTVVGTATTVSPDITLTPFFSGIALDVTPQIDADGRVTLHIHPTISQVTDQQKTITVSEDQELTLPLAFSTVRESDSIVNAASGQVVVIGGLMQNLSSKENAGIPLLGKVPGLGALFRHTKATSSKSELVILLRPVVIGEDGWEQTLQNSRDGFQQLGSKFNEEWRGGPFTRPAQ